MPTPVEMKLLELIAWTAARLETIEKHAKREGYLRIASAIQQVRRANVVRDNPRLDAVVREIEERDGSSRENRTPEA